MYNHVDLRFQMDWAGAQLINKRILVCSTCYDDPQPQLRAKILSADPLPIWNARPEPFTGTGFSYDESNIMCQPATTPGDFNSDFSPDFYSQQPVPYGSNIDGLQLLMPDGVTVMLMPNNPSGRSISGFDADFNNDFNADFRIEPD